MIFAGMSALEICSAHRRCAMNAGTTFKRRAVAGLGARLALRVSSLHQARRWLYAWGNADCGQLGLLTTALDDDFDTVGRSIGSARRVECDSVSTVAAGAAHTAMVNANGEMLTCGLNDESQLGRVAGCDGDDCESTFAKVHGLPSVYKAAAGGTHTLALSVDGKLYSFGSNSRGQLGRLDIPQAARYPSEPCLVDSLFDSEQVMIDVAAGIDFSMALTEDGRVYSWGSSDNGRLGLGATSSGGWLGQVLGRQAADEHRPRLMKALEGERVVAIFAGAHNAGALLSSGDYVVWGSGREFKLGTNKDADEWEPVRTMEQVRNKPVFGEFNSLKAKISFGLSHTLFLSGDGRLYASGSNHHGCLGVPECDVATTGTEVVLPGFKRVEDACAGWNVSIAVSHDGTVFSWGCGTDGALGRDEERFDFELPTYVTGVKNVNAVQMFSSGRHAFAWRRASSVPVPSGA